jgi:hypothetical protein
MEILFGTHQCSHLFCLSVWGTSKNRPVLDRNACEVIGGAGPVGFSGSDTRLQHQNKRSQWLQRASARLPAAAQRRGPPIEFSPCERRQIARGRIASGCCQTPMSGPPGRFPGFRNPRLPMRGCGNHITPPERSARVLLGGRGLLLTTLFLFQIFVRAVISGSVPLIAITLVEGV